MVKQKTTLHAPFLKRIEAQYDAISDMEIYPFSIPAISSGNFAIEFKNRVTIIAGDNGIGKSTLLEAIAAHCGFSLTGGTKNHAHMSSESETLSKFLRFSWLPKVTHGFFLRAETFFSFIQNIDDIAESSDSGIYDVYGGKSLRKRSHGESFIEIFENRFGGQGVFILDEPEAALSPMRQVDLLKLLLRMDQSMECQIIIATHSPLIMAYPNAQLIRMTSEGIEEVEFHEIDHFKILRDFYLNPDGFMAGVLMEETDIP